VAVKLVIDGAHLTSAAKWAAKVAADKPVNAIMGGVCLTAAEDHLQVSATNGDMFGTYAVPATAGQAGEIIVSARLLHTITATIPATGKVTLERGPRGLAMRCGTRWSLPELPGADTWSTFPDLGDLLGTIDTDVLSRTVSRVLPAVSTDEGTAKLGLTGVSCEVGEKLTFTASDRYRIAAAEAEWTPVPNIGERKLILSLSLLKIIMDGAHGTIEIYSDGNMVGFVSPPHRVIDRLMTGDYVKWRSIFSIPEDNPMASVAVTVADLSLALTQVGAGAGQFDSLRLRLSPEEIGVSLASTSDGDAENNDVEPQCWSGEPLTVGVNHRYLMDALSGLGSPMALMVFAGPSRPFMLRPADSNGQVIADGYGHQLMSLKLPDAGTAT
jgi:DNA polymerase-3 subunit beta